MRWGTMVNDIQEAEGSPIRKNLMPFSKFRFDPSDSENMKGGERFSELN